MYKIILFNEKTGTTKESSHFMEDSLVLPLLYVVNVIVSIVRNSNEDFTNLHIVKNGNIVSNIII